MKVNNFIPNFDPFISEKREKELIKLFMIRNMKLISFRPNGLAWEFTVENNGKQTSFSMKEKHNWPVLIGQPLELVEKWLFKNYLNLCYLAFGELTV